MIGPAVLLDFMGDISKKKHRKITGVQWCIAKNRGGYTLEMRHRRCRASRRRVGWGSSGGGVPLPSRLGAWGASWAPQRGPGRSPGRQRILGIFQRLRSLLVEGFWSSEALKYAYKVETMHYGVYGVISMFISSKQLQWLRSLRERQLGATRIGLNMRLATYRIRQVELEVNTNIVLNKESRDLAKFYNFAKKLVRPWPDRPVRPWPDRPDRFRRPWPCKEKT